MGHFVAVMPKFPARVVAGDGISIVKTGTTYTFSSTIPIPPDIGDLPVATLPLTGSEPLAIFQGGEARQITQRKLITALPMFDKGTVTSGTVTFDLADGPKQKLTVGGNLTIAVTGWPATGQYAEIEIRLINGGAFTVTWPSVKWLVGDGTNSTTFGDMFVSLQAADSNWVIIWSDTAGVPMWGKAG
jgi:hypothetical protein